MQRAASILVGVIGGYVLARRLVARRTRSVAALTDRQREVLRAVAGGLSTKEIAKLLGISEASVNTHVRRARTILGAPTRAGRIRSVLNQLRATGARRSATMPTSLPVMTTSRMRQPRTRLLMRLPEMLGPIATPIADRIDAAIGPRRTTPALGMIGKPSATRRPTDHGADAASGLRRITPARRMIGEPGATRRPIDHGAGATTDMTTMLAMMTAAARAAPHATAGGSCFLSSTNGEPIRRHRSRRLQTVRWGASAAVFALLGVSSLDLGPG